MDRILGLDQSTRKTGWAIMDGYDYVTSGVIRSDLAIKKKDSEDLLFDRICHTIVELNDIVEEYKPNVCVLEEVNAGLNKGTALKLAGVFWSIRYAMRIFGVESRSFHPSSWRALLWGGKRKRGEAKEKAMSFVNKNIGIDVTDDEAEAICIALAHTRKNSEMFDGDNFNW